MISKLHFKKIISLGILVSFIALSGCKDLFTDPQKDKDTGEDVTLLLLDRNFITTQLSVTLVDIDTQEQIEGEEVTIEFSGDDVADLITFGGNKQTTYTTSSGYVEVGYNPNMTINTQNPLELTVMATSTNYFGLPQFISYTTEGIKNVVIQMITIPTSLKSAKVKGSAYSEPFDMTFNGTKNSSDLNFLRDMTIYTVGDGYNYWNWYKPNTSGILVCDNLVDTGSYDDYGFIFTTYSPMEYSSVLKNATIPISSSVLSVVKPSGLVKCESGLTINVKRVDNLPTGSGVFAYKITFANGDEKYGKITCSFPSNNLIEQIYYSESNPAVTVELIGDAQYGFSDAVNLTSPCGTTASFTATPKNDLTAYKLVTNYKCPESETAYALTINGDFRKKGSTGAWTAFQFVGGVCDLRLFSNFEYDFRVNIDGKYYYYTLPTNPTLIKSYLTNTTNDDYQIKELKVEPEASGYKITAVVEFTSDDICDKLN